MENKPFFCLENGDEFTSTVLTGGMPLLRLSRISNLSIILCTAGSCTFGVNGRFAPFKFNQEWLLLPNDYLEVNYMSMDFKALCVTFSTRMFQEAILRLDPMLLIYIVKNSPYIHSPYTKHLSDIFFEQIEQIWCNKNHIYRREIAANLLRNFFFNAHNVLYDELGNSDISISKTETLAKQFYFLVGEFHSSCHQVNDYAKRLRISTRYLSRVVNEIFHTSPKEIIDDFVTLRIKEMLLSTELSVKEISFRLNFLSQSTMGRFFFSQVGMTPKEFRLKGLRS